MQSVAAAASSAAEATPAVRVLIIEDEAPLVRALASGLRERGFAVDVAHDGEEGLHFAVHCDQDAIVLDLMLPKLSGQEVLAALRAAGKETPVLILSARDSVEDKVEGFQLGTDDYLTKPFAFDELIVRLRALIRRRHGLATRRVEIGNLAIDLDARRVTCGDSEIDLTATEFAVLECLALNRGRVVSRTAMTEHLWSHDAEKLSNVLDVHIGNLRRKLRQWEHPDIIQTVRGAGYRLRETE